MKSISPDAKETVMQRKELLEKARARLKEEFIGIDKPIDNIIESFGYWYFFPDIHTRPVIINLWGLTGVGKTSLIIRLMELLDMKKKFHRFNLSDNEWDIRSTLSELSDNRGDNDYVILLDEFQHVRTISEDQTEKTNRHQFIWDLLDSGRIPVVNYFYRTSELSDLILRLSRLIQLGVVVRNGNVITGKEVYQKEMGEITTYNTFMRRTGKQLNPDLDFVPKYYHDIIFESDRENFPLQSDVARNLLTLNGHETIAFLKKIIRSGLASRHIDCTRSLVFIIGNLDEAYDMSGNFDTDIDADDFHAESLRISLPTIKEALRKRFRSEQISRLGNNHIIYPALSGEAYTKIIEMELAKMAQAFHTTTRVKIVFDSTLIRLLYDEGVFPTQGTRPLLSTIHSIVSAQLPKILFKIHDSAPGSRTAEISCNGDLICFRLLRGRRCLLEFSEKALLSLASLRECTNDDMQAITAVHESGHAVISVALLKIVPEIVCSVTTNPDNKGFIFSRHRTEYIARNEIASRVAVLLGGYAAEKLVFGEENLTTGAASDISQATQLVCNLLKSCGMGEVPASFHNEDVMTRFFLYDPTNSINDQAIKIIRNALSLAERTLSGHFSLLLAMSNHLSSNRVLRKKEITALIELTYEGTGTAEGLRDGPPSYYRNRLSQLIREGKNKQPADKLRKGEFGYRLNRD